MPPHPDNAAGWIPPYGYANGWTSDAIAINCRMPTCTRPRDHVRITDDRWRIRVVESFQDVIIEGATDDYYINRDTILAFAVYSGRSQFVWITCWRSKVVCTSRFMTHSRPSVAILSLVCVCVCVCVALNSGAKTILYLYNNFVLRIVICLYWAWCLSVHCGWVVTCKYVPLYL